MEFVYPSFLFALLAIIIPVIIHLFHFRRYKQIIFSDLRFLKQIQEQNKAQQKLKDWLILCCRILAITFLVLAFAQPFKPVAESFMLKGRKAVSIFIDNSYSMNNEGPEGNLLESGKNKARAIISAYANTDQFQILTHDMEGKHQRLVNQSDALQWVDEIKPSPASHPLSKIFTRQKQALEKSGDQVKLYYVISDFQQQMCDADQLQLDSGTQLNLVQVTPNEQHNLYIDSAWLTSPAVQKNEPAVIKARIRNYSTTAAENIPVLLKINGQQKGLQSITCDAGASAEITFTFTIQQDGPQQGEISLTDHPVIFDDKLYFNLTPVSYYQILCINGGKENPFISKLFDQDKTYQFTSTNQSQLNYGLFSRQQLIILNEPVTISSGLSLELKKFIDQGGQLLIIPPAAPESIISVNALLNELRMPLYGIALKQSLKINEINFQDPLFRNVFQRLPKNMDLPAVSEYYALQRNNSTKGKALMSLNNGQPFIWQSSVQKGNVVLFSAPLQTTWSNLHQHAVYVPLMLKLGTGKAKNEAIYYTIGASQWIPLQQAVTGEKLIRMWNGETDLMLATGQRQGKPEFFLDQHIEKAGVYNLSAQDSKTVQQLLAMNFDRKESDLTIWPKEAMNAFSVKWPGTRITGEDTAVLQHEILMGINGTPFWRYCVWLTLVFILIEILLLRLLK